MKTVLSRTRLSHSPLCRKIADGTFSKQVVTNIDGTGCYESAVNVCIANLAAYMQDDGAITVSL
ncbi:DNA-binding protein [Sphingobium sufflavum]|uniref:DNA-binding protein n=1 Tax=Sphingobium sufflavum TaxID=1129547 RepID=UPI001F15AF0F|nr:DNA-binding protein [Sphingobium sufflavum]MCE7796521.1 DNA-binding protein [Sphingobium sufflavum]